MAIKGFKVNGVVYKLDLEALEDADDLGIVCSFTAANGVEQGNLVTLSANNTVRAANMGESVVGYVVAVNNGIADVKMRGRVEVPYTGTLVLGWQDVTTQGTKILAAGPNDIPRTVLVISMDTTAKTAVVYLW